MYKADVVIEVEDLPGRPRPRLGPDTGEIATAVAKTRTQAAHTAAALLNGSGGSFFFEGEEELWSQAVRAVRCFRSSLRTRTSRTHNSEWWQLDVPPLMPGDVAFTQLPGMRMGSHAGQDMSLGFLQRFASLRPQRVLTRVRCPIMVEYGEDLEAGAEGPADVVVLEHCSDEDPSLSRFIGSFRPRESFVSTIASAEAGQSAHLWIGIDAGHRIIGRDAIPLRSHHKETEDAITAVVRGFVPSLDRTVRATLHRVGGAEPLEWARVVAFPVDSSTQRGAPAILMMQCGGRACVPFVENSETGDLQPSSIVLAEWSASLPAGWTDLGTDIRELTPRKIMARAAEAIGIEHPDNAAVAIVPRWVVHIEVAIPDVAPALWKGMTGFRKPSPNEVHAPSVTGPMTPLAVWAKLQQPQRSGAYFHGCVTAVVARKEVMEEVLFAARKLLPAHSELSSFDATVTIDNAAAPGAGDDGNNFDMLRRVFQAEWMTPRVVIMDIGVVRELCHVAETLQQRSSLEPGWHVVVAIPVDMLDSVSAVENVEVLLSELRRRAAYVALEDVVATGTHPRGEDFGEVEHSLPLQCDGRLQLVPVRAESWDGTALNNALRNWTEEGARPPWFVFHALDFYPELRQSVLEAVGRCLEGARAGCTEVQLMKPERGCGATCLLRSTLVALTREEACCCWVSTLAPQTPDDSRNIEQQRHMVAEFVACASRNGKDKIVVGLDDDALLPGPELSSVEALVERERGAALLFRQFREAVVGTPVRVCFLRVVPSAVSTWAAGLVSRQLNQAVTDQITEGAACRVVSGYLVNDDVDRVAHFFVQLYPSSKEALATARTVARESPARFFERHLCLFGWTALRGRYERLAETVRSAFNTLREIPEPPLNATIPQTVRSMAFATAYSPLFEGAAFPDEWKEQSAQVHEAFVDLVTTRRCRRGRLYSMRHPIFGDELLKCVCEDEYFYESPEQMANLWVTCKSAGITVHIDPRDVFITRGTSEDGRPYQFSRFVYQFFKMGCGSELDGTEGGEERCRTAHWLAWAVFHRTTGLDRCAAHVLLSRLHRKWAAASSGLTALLRAEDAVRHASGALASDPDDRSAKNNKALALFQLAKVMNKKEHAIKADEIFEHLFVHPDGGDQRRRNASNALREAQACRMDDDIIEKWQKRLDEMGGLAVEDDGTEGLDCEPWRLLRRGRTTASRED